MRPTTKLFCILGCLGAAAWVPKPYHHVHRIPSSSSSCTDKSRSQLTAKRAPVVETDREATGFISLPLIRKESSSASSSSMGDQVELLHNNDSQEDKTRETMSPELVGAGALAALVTVIAGVSAATSMDISLAQVVGIAQQTLDNPSATLESVVQTVDAMGPLGPVYFGVAYTIAEILAIPAIPLTASAGYLFGPVQGTGVVLLSASIAAAVSFVIGRTLLRDYVESVLEEYPKFAKIDRAIGREGFRLMFLLRLSPIFPFALSNYLYGASSINFSAFFWGTLFGFAPGTAAYVYTGYVGKALSEGGENAYPWFVYAGGLALFGGVLKVLADTATRVVEEFEEDSV